MKKIKVLLSVFMVFMMADFSIAEHSDIGGTDSSTVAPFELNDSLANSGCWLSWSVTNIYQSNVKGGLSTHNRRGHIQAAMIWSFQWTLKSCSA